MSPAGDAVLTGVTHWSRDLGPYVWHRFDRDRVQHDLQAIADAGVQTVRTLLPWDVFMPAITHPDDGALRNLETVLALSEAVGLRVVPVLFAQTLGDCVFLPHYAIDVDAARPGVRAVTDGVVQPGGPRDQYTDSRMIEAELRWLEAVLTAFAGNPVIAMWDLGHDPASVMRPRRIEQLRAWAAMLAGPVHDAGERCAVTLGVADITTARGVRLEAVASAVDALGLAVDAESLSFATPAPSAAAVTFVAQLALRLAAGDTPLHCHLSADHATDVEPEAIAGVQRFAGDSVDRLVDAGCAGIHAGAWSECSERVYALAPFDRRPDLARRGLVDTAGTPTAFGAAWLRGAANAGSAQPPQPWPESLDVADYYANLPHSIDDLFAEWARVAGD
ncbi:MAG: hypothetical protein JOZ75_05390 [Candidatus Dormibacteraeota bacterium]|nr:hypothetical protein [Candidatus Dormibacteraeota bacterium]